MDPRTFQYQNHLRVLRWILLIQGLGLFLLSMFIGRINGFIYIFIILNSIFLFCEINLKTTYQILIIINMFLLLKELIEFLMYLFYRPEEQQKDLEIYKPILMYFLSLLVLFKLILVSWRHYQNKICTFLSDSVNNAPDVQDDQYVPDF